jgi:hypothetical protein
VLNQRKKDKCLVIFKRGFVLLFLEIHVVDGSDEEKDSDYARYVLKYKDILYFD